jgi:hypothetical protein
MRVKNPGKKWGGGGGGNHWVGPALLQSLHQSICHATWLWNLYLRGFVAKNIILMKLVVQYVSFCV